MKWPFSINMYYTTSSDSSWLFSNKYHNCELRNMLHTLLCKYFFKIFLKFWSIRFRKSWRNVSSLLIVATGSGMLNCMYIPHNNSLFPKCSFSKLSLYYTSVSLELWAFTDNTICMCYAKYIFKDFLEILKRTL